MSERDHYDEMADDFWHRIRTATPGRLAAVLRAVAEEARKGEREACARDVESFLRLTLVSRAAAVIRARGGSAVGGCNVKQGDDRGTAQ